MLQAIKRQLNQVGSYILAYALQVLGSIQLTKVQTLFNQLIFLTCLSSNQEVKCFLQLKRTPKKTPLHSCILVKCQL